MQQDLRLLQRNIRRSLRGQNLVCGFRRPQARILLCARRQEAGWEVHCRSQATGDHDTLELEIGLPCPDYADYRAGNGYFDHEGATEYEMRLSARHLERHLEQWSLGLLALDRQPQVPALSLVA